MARRLDKDEKDELRAVEGLQETEPKPGEAVHWQASSARARCVTEGMIKLRGREHTAALFDKIADRIRVGEIGEHVGPERPTIH